MDRKVFFRMSDRHFGGAPQITEDTCDYHGYFEGSCGDQNAFLWDKLNNSNGALNHKVMTQLKEGMVDE